MFMLHYFSLQIVNIQETALYCTDACPWSPFRPRCPLSHLKHPKHRPLPTGPGRRRWWFGKCRTLFVQHHTQATSVEQHCLVFSMLPPSFKLLNFSDIYIWDLISCCCAEKVILKHHAYRGVETYNVNRLNMKETDCVVSSRWLCYKQTQVWSKAMQAHELFSQGFRCRSLPFGCTQRHILWGQARVTLVLFFFDGWVLHSSLIPVVPMMDQGFKHFASVKGSLGT